MAGQSSTTAAERRMDADPGAAPWSRRDGASGGPVGTDRSCGPFGLRGEQLRGLMAPMLPPNTPAKVELVERTADTAHLRFDGIKVSVFQQTHPGGCIGYAFEHEGRKVPYTCTQCDEAWCMSACPVEAIKLDGAIGEALKALVGPDCPGLSATTITASPAPSTARLWPASRPLPPSAARPAMVPPRAAGPSRPRSERV